MPKGQKEGELVFYISGSRPYKIIEFRTGAKAWTGTFSNRVEAQDEMYEKDLIFYGQKLKNSSKKEQPKIRKKIKDVLKRQEKHQDENAEYFV